MTKGSYQDHKKLVRQIRKLRQRKVRERTGTFYAEGNRIVAQAIAAGANIRQCVVAPDLVSSDLVWQSVAALREQGTPVDELSADQFSGISFKRNLSGIGVVIRARQESLADVRLTEGLGWVALAHVSNAGNLGAVLRTCDAVGCEGVILLGETTDAYHPDTVKASMGAIFSLRLVKASWAQFAEWKTTHDYPLIGTSGEAAQTYRQFNYTTPLVLLMGSERLGLRPEQAALCDAVVSIPMVGTGDSLNLAVATGVALYEIFHQARIAWNVRQEGS